MITKRYSPLDMPFVNKHLWRCPGWMPTLKYREYQETRVNTARIKRDESKQKEDRHNAFVENAKKHGIPISKTSHK